MANFPAAPTYAEVIVQDPVTKIGRFNPIWLKWFLDLAGFVTASGGGGGGTDHESLAGLLGGAASDHYHLTNAERTPLIAGFTGTGLIARQTSATWITPILGTPASGTLTNCTGLPIATGISGLGADIATWAAAPSSANLLAAMTDKTGTGLLVFRAAPTLITPTLGTATATGLTFTGNLLGKSAAGLTNGAGAAAGTIANAPAAGNPTKWVPFDDNGTTRYVPMW